MGFEKKFLLLLLVLSMLLLVGCLEKKLAKMVSERKVGKRRGKFVGEEGEEGAFAGAGGAFLRLGGEGLEKWGKIKAKGSVTYR